jgi:hypothetical protein
MEIRDKAQRTDEMLNTMVGNVQALSQLAQIYQERWEGMRSQLNAKIKMLKLGKRCKTRLNS